MLKGAEGMRGDEFYRELFHISTSVQLKEGVHGIIRVLTYLFRYQSVKIKNKRLARLCNISVPVLSALRSELEKKNFLVNKEKNQLSENAVRALKSFLGLRFEHPIYDSTEIPTKLEDFHKKIQHYYPQIKNHLTKRPHVKYRLDQAHGTPFTLFRKIMVLINFGAIEGKDVLLLGDDDAISVILFSLNVANKVIVVDIDADVLSFIEKKYEELNPTIEMKLIQLDIRENYRLHNIADTVLLDPPYTISGGLLFTSRAITSLKKKPQTIRKNNTFDEFTFFLPRFIGLSFHPPYLDAEHRLQEFIIKANGNFTLIYPHFNKYTGGSIIGNSSNFYLAQFSGTIYEQPLQLPENDIYTYREKPIEKNRQMENNKKEIK